MRLSLVLVLSLAGCWRGGAEAGAEELPAVRVKGASCDEASDNARKVIAASEDPELAARAEPLAEIVHRRCGVDGWSMELRRCVTGAPTFADLDGCEKLATGQQRAKLQRDIEVFEIAEDKQ
ncbi:MAG: hypothetical protein HOV81_11805 [Kofleriaceae bacterium]|nr:hypothetical protein [Kofleriaceae bacterium]